MRIGRAEIGGVTFAKPQEADNVSVAYIWGVESPKMYII